MKRFNTKFKGKLDFDTKVDLSLELTGLLVKIWNDDKSSRALTLEERLRRLADVIEKEGD